jgi:Phage integrase, N-terminal SAM-like domain
MAHIQRKVRRDGARRYEVRWVDPDGQHRTKGGFDKRAMAEAYCREVEVRLANRTYVNPSAGRGSFRELADAWLDSKSGVLKPRTREGYANLLKPGRDIDGTFGGYPVDKITRQQVAEWVTAQQRLPTLIERLSNRQISAELDRLPHA